MRTRSGVEIDPPKFKTKTKQKKKRRFVLHSDIRENGEDTPCQCPMCLSRFIVTNTPEWYQCPACATLFHISCLLKHIQINLSNPCCPHCKTVTPVTIDDGYINADQLDTLWAPSVDFS